MSGPFEIYRPRTTEDRGVWEVGGLRFKIYDLLAEGKTVKPEMTEIAMTFLQSEVMGDVAAMGDSNELGFVIVHPGDLGLTIAAHWWAQGSVLCQRIYRRQYADNAPLDTVKRPAVACVWELEIIQAEQEIWRKTMMSPEPDPSAYLRARAV